MLKTVKRDFPYCNTFCLRLSAISVCKMAAKRRKLDMPAVEEVKLDSATSDGDYDFDKEVYEGCVSAHGLPHGQGTMTWPCLGNKFKATLQWGEGREGVLLLCRR